MSWSDDIRCLYCDGPLPLYRKITNGQFCSAAHRKAYWQEQERLAVERLHHTHDTLRAFRPGADVNVEAIIGPVPEVEPQVPQPLSDGRPPWMPLVNRGEVPEAGLLLTPAPQLPRWPEDRLADPEPLEFVSALALPFPIYQALRWRFALAPATTFQIAAAQWMEPDHTATLVPMEVVL